MIRTGKHASNGRELLAGDEIEIPDKLFRYIWNLYGTSEVGGKTIEEMPRQGTVGWCDKCARWELQFWATPHISWDVGLAPFHATELTFIPQQHWASLDGEAPPVPGN